MAKLTLEELADKGFELKQKMDKLSAQLDEVKTEIKIEAKAKKLKVVIGKKGRVTVSPWSKTDVGPEALYDMLVSLGRDDEFYECVNVAQANAKTKMSEAHWDEIATVKTKPYHTVSFKKVKKS